MIETFPWFVSDRLLTSFALTPVTSCCPTGSSPLDSPLHMLSHRIGLSLLLKHHPTSLMVWLYVCVNINSRDSKGSRGLSVCLFETCLDVTVQRRILPSLPHDEELSKWSYHWFILPALSAWLMALYTQANPSSNYSVFDSLEFINEANIFMKIESPSQNTLIESSVCLDFF